MTVTTTVTASRAGTALIDIELYGPTGKKTAQRYWSAAAFAAGVPRTLRWTWYVSSTRAIGPYTVKIGVFRPAWGALLVWNNRASLFRVIR